MDKDRSAQVSLPADYVGAKIDYGYASTVDKAQGATVDHVRYHPTDRSSSEGAYAALSRAGSRTGSMR